MNSPEKSPEEDSPAEQLAGLVLLDRWVVTQKYLLDEGDTGRTRSCCYHAVDLDGCAVFIKAFCFELLDLAGDTEELQRQLAEFHNERKIHEHCSSTRRVTKILGHGHVVIDGRAVHFLVCEAGSASLRRSQPPGDEGIPASVRLKALRQITSALIQMHKLRVAHQDLKPSNAVAFAADDIVKIADLGSASCSDLPSPPHDEEAYAGQVNYVPYELLYSRAVQPNWYRRRIGCDVFLLGNLIFTSFAGYSLSAFLLHALPVPLRHTTYHGEYEQVLPDLVVKHRELVPILLAECIPDFLVSDVVDLVLRLCHPDPLRRGMGNAGAIEGPFDLQRCEGRLNTLSRKAELYEQRSPLVR